MAAIAGYVKLLAIFFFSFFYSLFYLFIRGILIVFGRSAEPWRNFFMKTWARGAAFLLNVRVQVRGNPPAPPFFLVSNHLSYIDIIPLYLTLQCTFVAKKEVRSWPLLGYIIDKVGVIFVDRTRKSDVVRVNELMKHSINRYQGMVVFPEGTTSDGSTVLPFKPSLLEIPASNNLEVYTAAVQYQTTDQDLPASESVCFFGARHTFGEHLKLLVQNKKIECRIVFDGQPVSGIDRKELAQKLQQKVKKQLRSGQTVS